MFITTKQRMFYRLLNHNIILYKKGVILPPHINLIVERYLKINQ
jgi:hypothetical protein